jgi:Zn-dependent protease with chaperone function
MPRKSNASTTAEVAARLQTDAQRNPRAYRGSLIALALLGDLTLTAAQVFPLAAPILIGMFFVNLPLFHWLGGAAILFLVWLLRPRFRTTGRAVSRDEAPVLFEQLDLLRKKLDVPGEMEVFVDEAFNASAGEPPGLLALLRRRSVLTLGLPLLLTLTREQVLAVIAHELGHFSRRPRRFGQWVYRARVGWLEYARELEAASPLERAAAWYAKRFVPYFSVRSFVYSRMCEYEADRDAASVVGAAAVASALSSIAVVARVWNEGVPREMARLQLESPEPPGAPWEQFAKASLAWPRGAQEEWLRKEVAAPSGWLDTHPSLAERVRSLGEEPRLDMPTGERAGPSLFGARWPSLVKEFDATLLVSVKAEWLMQHLRLKHIVHPLLETDAEAAARWDAEKRLARAKALRWLQPAQGLIELRALHAAHPANRRIGFAYAAALLAEDDEAGVAPMETLARDHAELRSPAYSRLGNYFTRYGDGDRAEYWYERLRQSDARRSDAMAVFLSEVEEGRALPTSLQDAERRVMAEAIDRDPCITAAWMMQATVPLATAESAIAGRLTVHALVLAVDTAQIQRNGTSEEQINDQYARALESLVPADEQVIVRTYLTTEPLPELDSKYALNAAAAAETPTP